MAEKNRGAVRSEFAFARRYHAVRALVFVALMALSTAATGTVLLAVSALWECGLRAAAVALAAAAAGACAAPLALHLRVVADAVAYAFTGRAPYLQALQRRMGDASPAARRPWARRAFVAGFVLSPLSPFVVTAVSYLVLAEPAEEAGVRAVSSARSRAPGAAPSVAWAFGGFLRTVRRLEGAAAGSARV